MRKEDGKDFQEIEDTPELHTEIDKIAKKATQNAYKNAKSAGLAVTYGEGDLIIKELPDGKLAIVETKKLSPRRKVEKGSRGKL